MNQHNNNNENSNNSGVTSNGKHDGYLFSPQFYIDFDDFLFELVIQQIAQHSKSKFVFFNLDKLNKMKEVASQNKSKFGTNANSYDQLNVDQQYTNRFVSEMANDILDVLNHKRDLPGIYWNGHLAVIDTNVACKKTRLIYCDEKQIRDGLKLIETNTLQPADIVYIHISLWMKPKNEFKRLIMAHLCRFESICFYTVGSHELDARAVQIVQWLFGNKIQSLAC